MRRVEERLRCGQNNLTSRCAEAGGKSIQMMSLKQVMSILSKCSEEGEGFIFNSDVDRWAV